MQATEVTALSDPESYLSLIKFNRRLNCCPRTNLPVTFSDIGDENGVPVLYVLPSGCSRWVAAPMDPLAKKYGVRMIVVDRPGCGGTGQIPLDQRIERSGEMMVSVLEHLKIKPAHIYRMLTSIVSYTLHLLIHHASAFKTSLNPPPTVYMMAPWVPLLSPEDPEYWPFKWDWIPSPLIATQHITTPHLIKAAEQVQKAYDKGLKAFEEGKTLASKWYRSFAPISPQIESPNSPTETVPSMSSEPYGEPGNDFSLGKGTQAILSDMRGAGVVEDTNVSRPEDSASQESRRTRYWGQTPCCVSCLVNGYMQVENGQGIGQEHLLCLNRGSNQTGSQWLKTSISNLAATIELAQCLAPILTKNELAQRYSIDEMSFESVDTPDSELMVKRPTKVSPISTKPLHPLKLHVWWGWQDDMVPRKGQIWFNNLVQGYSGMIDLAIHDVPNGDHVDLLSRKEGIHQCLQLIQHQNDKTPLEAE
nr:hypothetical protein L203_01179 [Cryptococcus depauperatus CBS 7841]